MISQPEGRNYARLRVQQELSHRQINIAELARQAEVDPGTVGDFVNGSRWPQVATRSKIATALGWSADSFDRMVRGDGPLLLDSETVGPGTDDAGVLLSMPPEVLDGLGPAEREEVITAAKLSALTKAREIRKRLDE